MKSPIRRTSAYAPPAWLGACLLALGLAATGAAAAAQDPIDPSPEPIPESAQSAPAGAEGAELVKGSDLIGTSVLDSAKMPAGVVRDVVLARDGAVLAVLVEPLSGIGTLAVPAEALEPVKSERSEGMGDDDSVVCQLESLRLRNTTTDELAAVPRCTLSDPLDQAKLRQVYEHFDLPLAMPREVASGASRTGDTATGDDPTDEGSEAERSSEDGSVNESADGNLLDADLSATLASEVTRQTVENLQGEELGRIRDLAIRLDRPQVVYAVLESGGVLGVGEKLFAVPFASLDDRARAERLILDIEAERLEQAEGFEEWPAAADETLFSPSRFSQVRPPARSETPGSSSGG